MKTTLFINPLDLQRAAAFTGNEKINSRPVLMNIEIEYAAEVMDETIKKTALGKSKLRATDSYRMIEIETQINTENDLHAVAGKWYMDRLDALAAIAKARIKKFPYAICEVTNEVQGFPNVEALWDKPAAGLDNISFSSKLLADSIKALKCRNVKLEFAGANDRVLIIPDNTRVRALIMPIRTDI